MQGMMQALDKMSAGAGVAWIVLPLAILMIASILGSTSAWTRARVVPSDRHHSARRMVRA